MRRSLQLRTQSVKRFIFTATTGRSGTLTLSELFSTVVPECTALHEPYPIMNEGVLRAASYGDEAEVDRVYNRVKSINILRAAVGRRYYLEANHLLVKTFLGRAYEEFGRRMAVIHLVRAPIEVAMSIYCLQHLPGTPVGDAWWLDYRAPSNILKMEAELESGELAHPFFRGLWYWYELELRFAAWRARLPRLQVVRFETPWFNDGQKTFGLLDELEIVYDREKVATFIGRKEHTKFAQKTMPVIPRAQAERMDETFRRVVQERGIDLSPIGRL